MLFFVLLVSASILNVKSNLITTFLKCPDGTNDCVTNFARELYSVIVNPNPDIGAVDMDPLYQELIKGKLETIEYTIINATIKGFRSCKVESASRNQEKQTLQLNLLCPYYDFRGKYNVNGKLLRMSVTGNGDFILNSGKYDVIVDIQFEVKSKDGKEYMQYMHIKSVNYKANPIDPLTFNLTNLFGGDKELGDQFLKFANENWKPVTYVLQDPIFKANLKKLVKNSNKYMKTMAIN